MALLNIINHLSHSLITIREFRHIINKRDGVKSTSPIKEAEAIKIKLLLKEEEDNRYPNFIRLNKEGLTVIEEF